MNESTTTPDAETTPEAAPIVPDLPVDETLALLGVTRGPQGGFDLWPCFGPDPTFSRGTR